MVAVGRRDPDGGWGRPRWDGGWGREPRQSGKGTSGAPGGAKAWAGDGRGVVATEIGGGRVGSGRRSEKARRRGRSGLLSRRLI
jgi:hypothetical protein